MREENELLDRYYKGLVYRNIIPSSDIPSVHMETLIEILCPIRFTSKVEEVKVLTKETLRGINLLIDWIIPSNVYRLEGQYIGGQTVEGSLILSTLFDIISKNKYDNQTKAILNELRKIYNDERR